MTILGLLHSQVKQGSCLLIKPLKFIYLGSNISSIESAVNIRIGKAWRTIEMLSTIYKSDLSDKIKREYFQVEAV